MSDRHLRYRMCCIVGTLSFEVGFCVGHCGTKKGPSLVRQEKLVHVTLCWVLLLVVVVADV